MNVQELIDKYKEYENALFDIGAKVACQKFLQDLEQLDEPKKVTIPQFVGDWIEESKKSCENVVEFFGYRNPSFEITKWIEDGERFDLVARAWLDGYEVEKEKRYFVKIKAADQYLVRVEDENFLGFLQSRLRSKFTRKELEELEFGWVFDCPGIQIEEVE